MSWNWNLFISFCLAFLFVAIAKLAFGTFLGVYYGLFLTGVNIVLVVWSELSRRRTNKNVQQVLAELKRDSSHVPIIANRPPTKEDNKFSNTPHLFLWVCNQNKEYTYYVYYWHTLENKEWIKLKAEKE